MRWLFFPPILMLAVFAPAAVAYRYLDPAGRPPFVIYGIRWFLGILFVISGLAKLIPHFPNTMGPPNLEATLQPYGLALYARFIAVSEVGVGLLLLTRRFATLGALFLLPMLASILVITTALQWRGTPIVVGGFLVLTLALLLYDYPKLMSLVGDRRVPQTDQIRRELPTLFWLAAAGIVLTALGTIRLESRSAPGVWLALLALLTLIVIEWRRESGN